MDKGPLEKTVEQKISTWAKHNGWLSYKWAAPGRVGVPDRIFIKNGIVAFLEVKRKGRKPTGIQNKTINTLLSHGMRVAWCDSSEEGIAWLKRQETGHHMDTKSDP